MINENLFIETICNYGDVTIEQLKSKSRKQKFVTLRHLGMCLLVEENRLSQEHIANLFGRVNHATVIHAREKVRSKIKASDIEFSRKYRELKKLIEP